MAKKKPTTTKLPRQAQLTGEGFPPVPPQAVLDARDEFVTMKRRAANATKKRNESEAALIGAMKLAGVRKVYLDGENKFIRLSEKDNLKIEKVPKAGDEATKAAAAAK